MEDDKYDKIENLFRSRLGDAGQSREVWNTPPPSLLEGALDIVNEDYHKKGRAFWMYLSLGLLLLGFAGGMIYSHFIIKDLNQKITTLQDQQSEWIQNQNLTSNESEYTIQNELFNNEGRTEEAIAEVSLNEHNVEGKVEGKTNPRRPEQVILKVKNTMPLEDQNARILDHTIDGNLPSNQKTSVNDLESKINTTPLLSVQELTVDPITIEKLKNEFQLISSNNETLIRPNPYSKNQIVQDELEQASWSPYVFLGSQLSSYHMTNVSSSKTQLRNYDNLYAGIQVGGGVEKSLSNRLKAFGNVSYQKINNTSSYSESMIYEKDKEVFDVNGQCSYTMDYQVETPMGIQNRSISMDMTHVNVNDQELIQNVTDIEHTLDVLTTSIGLKYRLLRKGRFDLSASIALSGNYIWGIQEDMNTKIYYQTLMVMEKDAVNSSLTGVNRWYASIYGGVDVSYRLSDHFRLGLNGGYDHSLNSLRKSTSGSPRTYLANIRSSLNLAYHF